MTAASKNRENALEVRSIEFRNEKDAHIAYFRDKLNEAEEENTRLKAQIKDMSNTKSELDGIKAEFDDTKAGLNGTKAELDNTKSKLDEAQKENREWMDRFGIMKNATEGCVTKRGSGLDDDDVKPIKTR